MVFSRWLGTLSLHRLKSLTEFYDNIIFNRVTIGTAQPIAIKWHPLDGGAEMDKVTDPKHGGRKMDKVTDPKHGGRKMEAVTIL